MTKYLVISNCDYADEFDVHGFLVLTKEELDYYDERAKKVFTRLEEKNKIKYEEAKKSYIEQHGDSHYFYHHGNDELEFYFGTNESIFFSDYEDWKSNFTIKELTDTEAAVLENLFDGNFGRSFYTDPSDYSGDYDE